MATLTSNGHAASAAIALAGVRRIGLGCMALTGIYGHVPSQQARCTISAALDAGITMFDTAPLYGDGENEKLVGEVVGARNGTTIVTKFGLATDQAGNLVRDSSPISIRQSVERSLRRLRRERIDLLLQHRHDAKIPMHDVAGCIRDLIGEGKVKAFGLSSVTTERISDWTGSTRIDAVQNEMSMLTGIRSQELQTSAELGIPFIAHSPLGRGLLVGSQGKATDDLRRQMAAFRSCHITRPEHELPNLHAKGRPHTLEPIAAIRWVLDQASHVVAIPGCKSAAQVREILPE